MKRLKILILTIGAIGLLSSCGTKRVLLHVPLSIPSQCNFTKYPEFAKIDTFVLTLSAEVGEELLTITDAIGQRIDNNQQTCKLRQKRIDKDVKDHNTLHGGDK